MTTIHLFISGFVQGVGFRQFVKHHAQKLRITGWVTNLPDGRVEALLKSSDKKNLDKLVELCNKGPFLADVREVAIEMQKESKLFKGFEVKNYLQEI